MYCIHEKNLFLKSDKNQYICKKTGLIRKNKKVGSALQLQFTITVL